MKQFYILEMNGFTEDESQDFLNEILWGVDWKEGQGVGFSHLTEKGVEELKKYILKEGDM